MNDRYGWQPLPDGRLAVSLADVTGHGIGPALVTAVCRAYSRATFSTDEEIGAQLDRSIPLGDAVELEQRRKAVSGAQLLGRRHERVVDRDRSARLLDVGAATGAEDRIT